MALEDPEVQAKILARLREKYRGRYPHERLILLVDRRAGARYASHVVVVDRDSPWYDLYPPEQIGELVDRERPTI